MTTTYTATPTSLTTDSIQAVMQQRFVRIPGIISMAEVVEFYAAALDLAQRMMSYHNAAVFTQLVSAGEVPLRLRGVLAWQVR